MRKCLCLCILLSFLLCGCSQPHPAGERAEFDSYLDGLDAERKENLIWSREERALFPEYAPDFSDQIIAFSQEELDTLITEREESDITGAEAAEDIDMLFRLLQSTYGGYAYFGGDDIFLPIREKLLSMLENKDDISSEELGKMMYSALSDYIVDGHFTIGTRYFTMDSEKFMYYVPNLYFHDISGIDAGLVKPTIGPDGELAFLFAALSHDGADLPSVAAVDGKQKELKWQKADTCAVDEQSERLGYRKTSVSDIPVLESRILYPMDGDKDIQGQLEMLAASGAEYRGLPVLIVDIRQNGGGNASYAKSWVEGFTGGQVQTKAAFFDKCSQAFIKILDKQYDDVDPELKYQFYQSKGRWRWGAQDGAVLDNKTVVFLLTDKGVGSSGEDFVRMLSTVAHVVRVGTNTAGRLQFGNICDFHLPHSGIFIRMGSRLSFYDNLEKSEGAGVTPNLWVNGRDALDAVIRMCNYYGLTEPPADN